MLSPAGCSYLWPTEPGTRHARRSRHIAVELILNPRPFSLVTCPPYAPRSRDIAYMDKPLLHVSSYASIQ